MTKKSNQSQPEIIDDEVLSLLNESVAPVQLSAQKKLDLLDEIWNKIDAAPSPEQNKSDSDLVLTVRKDEGKWIRIAPKIKKKVLYTDSEKNIEAYLLQILPGGSIPEHFHNADELCIVLEGSVSFADIHLSQGDFHVAKEGSLHGASQSDTGAILYLQSRLEQPIRL